MSGNVHHKPTQNERILAYIDRFGSITQLEAIRDLGVMRLASRISDLRRLGHPITSDFEETKNRFGEKCRFKRYRLQKGSGSDANIEGNPVFDK